MMMLVLTVCSFEGTWNIDRNEKQCESAVFFVFARHGRALTGASPEHAQIVGSV